MDHMNSARSAAARVAQRAADPGYEVVLHVRERDARRMASGVLPLHVATCVFDALLVHGARPPACQYCGGRSWTAKPAGSPRDDRRVIRCADCGALLYRCSCEGQAFEAEYDEERGLVECQNCGGTWALLSPEGSGEARQEGAVLAVLEVLEQLIDKLKQGDPVKLGADDAMVASACVRRVLELIAPAAGAENCMAREAPPA